MIFLIFSYVVAINDEESQEKYVIIVEMNAVKIVNQSIFLKMSRKKNPSKKNRERKAS